MDLAHINCSGDDGMPYGRLRALWPTTDTSTVVDKAIPGRPADSLVLSRKHNRTQSPLLRLPDELLVLILHALGRDNTLAMDALRQTSHTFMRLYSGAEFRHLQDAMRMVRKDGRPWVCRAAIPGIPTPANSRDRARYRNHVVLSSFGRGDTTTEALYKTDCLGYMHCARCSADHPRAMFSDKQRLTIAAPKRRCLAYEGRLNLCDHMRLSLVRIEDLIQLRKRQGRDKPLLGPDSGSSRENDTVHYGTFACRHPSHVPQQHRHLFPGAAHLQTAVEERLGAVFPSFAIYGALAQQTLQPQQRHQQESRTIVATWRYTAHVDLSAWVHGPEERLAAQTWRDIVTYLRLHGDKIDPTVPCIVVDTHAGPPPELRCVDPTRCGCLLIPDPDDRSSEQQQKQRPCMHHETTQNLDDPLHGAPDVLKVRLSTCTEPCTTMSDAGGLVPTKMQRCLRIDYTRTLHLMRPGRAAVAIPQQQTPTNDDAPFGPHGVEYGWYRAVDLKTLAERNALSPAMGLLEMVDKRTRVPCAYGCLRNSFEVAME